MLIFRVLPRVTYPGRNVTSDIKTDLKAELVRIYAFMETKSHFLFGSLLGYCISNKKHTFYYYAALSTHSVFEIN